jgi:hypothetical protein
VLGLVSKETGQTTAKGTDIKLSEYETKAFKIIQS